MTSLTNTLAVSLSGWHASVSRLDAVIFKSINGGLACPFMDHFMVAATLFGVGTMQVALSLILVAMGWWMRQVNWRRAGYAGISAFLFSGIAVQIFKHLWDRPRPLLVLLDVRCVDEVLFAHSFPSGHTTTAFAVMFACSAFLPRLRYVLIPFAFLTGLSRVYLGVHFPLDVAYGALVGTIIGILSARGIQSFITKEPNNKENKGPDAALDCI